MKKSLILLFIWPLFLAGQDYTNLEGVEFKGEITAPEGYSLFPGQLEKNGDYYNLPVMDTSGNGFLYRYAIKSSGKYSLDKIIEIGTFSDRIFSGQATLSENNQIMVFTTNFEESWSNNDLCISEYDSKANKFKNIRLLGELNELGISDAYSYLSADGLHLYFLQGDKLKFSSRQDIKYSFKYPREINLNPTLTNIVSCWLTSDELTLYIISDNVVYTANRASRSEKYSPLIEYITSFKSLEYVSGFSMSEKSKLVFVYYSPSEKGNEAILIYKMK